MTAEEDVVRFFHDGHRNLYGVPEPLKSSHCPAIPVRSAHDARIQFVRTRCSVDCAPSRVEEAVVLHQCNGSNDGIGCTSSLVQNVSSGLQCFCQRKPIGSLLLGTEAFCPEMTGSAMNGNGPMCLNIFSALDLLFI